MPRRARNTPAGWVYHVLNRGVGRQTLFHKPEARAEDWMWRSLWRRENNRRIAMLSDGPVERPSDWVAFVNEPQTPEELEALRRSVNRGPPFGEDEWQQATVEQLGLEWTLRPRGQPRKTAVDAVEPAI